MGWNGKGITEDLLDLGVAKEDIVLGFLRPEQKPLGHILSGLITFVPVEGKCLGMKSNR